MSTKTFLVLRLGHNVAASLDNKNAANIGGMASFILSALDKDIAFGDKLSLYEVTAELPFAGYIQYRGSSVQNRYLDGDVRAEHVGEMTIHTNAKWYSFPAGGKWKAHLKRTVDNAIHVLDAMVPERFPREKRIAMCGEVQIQQLLKHVFHEMHEGKNMKTTTKIVEALLGENLPPGFDGFDDPSPSHSSSKGDQVIHLISSAKYGSILKVGGKKFKVFKPQGQTAYATLDGTSGRKFYRISPVAPDSDEAQVWLMVGSQPSQKMMTGKVSA